MPKHRNPILTNRIWFDGAELSIAEAIAQFARRISAFGLPAGRIAITSDSALELLGAAAWVAQTGRDALVVPGERMTEALETVLRERGFHVCHVARGSVVASSKQVPVQDGRVTLLTSGTTGDPKLVEHTWETLFTMAKVRADKPSHWLLTYQPGTYAWYQMLGLLLFVPGQALTVVRDRTPVALFEAARRSEVSAISSTPTLWRLAMLQVPPAELKELKLQQITLGGEAVDQSILEQLRLLYPAAVLTHIYASTEAGACIVVRDGKEGFPAAWLATNGKAEHSSDSPQLQIREGYLWIRSPYAVRPQTEWLNSGDRVELRGDRAIILGRAENAFINVGGAKVAAQEVEQVLLQHPAILWCRVHGCRAPLVGELVGADVVFRPRAARPPEAELVQFCTGRMAAHMVPRVWKYLEEIPVTGNLKSKLA